jgi:AsmA protein
LLGTRVFGIKPTVEVKGGGTANLNNDALDYKVIAKIKKGGKNVTNRPVAVNVKGTFSKPVYTVDLTSIESMMTEEEKQKVNKFIQIFTPVLVKPRE